MPWAVMKFTPPPDFSSNRRLVLAALAVTLVASAGLILQYSHLARTLGDPDDAMRLVLAGAILLVTPYLRAYDMLLLVLPIAMLVRGPMNLAEKAIIFAAWLVPAVLMFSPPAIQFGPVVSVALLIMLFRRVLVGHPVEEGVKCAP